MFWVLNNIGRFSTVHLNACGGHVFLTVTNGKIIGSLQSSALGTTLTNA